MEGFIKRERRFVRLVDSGIEDLDEVEVLSICGVISFGRDPSGNFWEGEGGVSWDLEESVDRRGDVPVQVVEDQVDADQVSSPESGFLLFLRKSLFLRFFWSIGTDSLCGGIRIQN